MKVKLTKMSDIRKINTYFRGVGNTLFNINRERDSEMAVQEDKANEKKRALEVAAIEKAAKQNTKAKERRQTDRNRVMLGNISRVSEIQGILNQAAADDGIKLL